MNKKIWIYRGVLFVLTLSLLVFIFVTSSKNGEQSYEQSEGVTGGVVDVINPDLGASEDPHDKEAVHAIHALIRQAAHVCEYTLLAFLVTLLLDSYGVKKWWLALGGIAFTVVYAISDEVHQHFVPGRTGSVEDVLYDSLGAILGWACAIFAIWLFWNVQRRRQKTK